MKHECLSDDQTFPNPLTITTAASAGRPPYGQCTLRRILNKGHLRWFYKICRRSTSGPSLRNSVNIFDFLFLTPSSLFGRIHKIILGIGPHKVGFRSWYWEMWLKVIILNLDIPIHFWADRFQTSHDMFSLDNSPHNRSVSNFLISGFVNRKRGQICKQWIVIATPLSDP